MPRSTNEKKRAVKAASTKTMAVVSITLRTGNNRTMAGHSEQLQR